MNFFTRQQLAENLHCNPRTLGREERRGKLKGIKIGKRTLYSEAEIERYLKEKAYGGRKVTAGTAS